MNSINNFLLLLFIALLIVSSAAKPKPAKKPANIVYIIADDLGWNNVGYRGNKEVKTPNMDYLATSYIQLDRFYVSNWCTPTRTSALTGRVPGRVFWGPNSLPQASPLAYNPNDPISGYFGIPLGYTTLGEKLKALGYKTVFTGKWGVGQATPLHTPKFRGFDRSLIYFFPDNDYYQQTMAGQSMQEIYQQTKFYDSDKPPVPVTASFFVFLNGDKSTFQNPTSHEICRNVFRDLWMDDRPAYEYANSGYLEDSFTQFTLSRIHEHNPDDPLFLVHSFHLVHAPLQVPIAWQQPFINITWASRRKFNGMLYYMDTTIGSIVNALQVKGMFENTLILFHSDNGGLLRYRSAGNNYPLRGGKFSDFDGGYRVTAFAAGGAIPLSMRGKILDQYIHVADLLPTFLDFAGAPKSFYVDDKAAKYDLPGYDGISMYDLLTGKSTTPKRNEVFLSQKSLIVGKYKLITGLVTDGHYQAMIYPTQNTLQSNPIVGINANSTYNSTFGQVNCGNGCLYDIQADPYETTNLAQTYPDVLQTLILRLTALNQTLFIPNRGSASPLGCQVASTVYGGFFGPFVPIPEICSNVTC